MIIPKGISLLDWSASLLIDFPDNNIPILRDETKWKEWGNRIISETTVAAKGVPPTDSYQFWDEWAMVYYNIMNNLGE